jgi:hypothetical protein
MQSPFAANLTNRKHFFIGKRTTFTIIAGPTAHYTVFPRIAQRVVLTIKVRLEAVNSILIIKPYGQRPVNFVAAIVTFFYRYELKKILVGNRPCVASTAVTAFNGSGSAVVEKRLIRAKSPSTATG